MVKVTLTVESTTQDIGQKLADFCEGLGRGIMNAPCVALQLFEHAFGPAARKQAEELWLSCMRGPMEPPSEPPPSEKPPEPGTSA